MIVGAQQPCFLPWVGYWNKLMSVDVLVDMPHSQMEKGDYFNRVMIEGQWATLPVSFSLGDSVAQTVLAKEAPHAAFKLAKRIRAAYQHAPYFYSLEPILVTLATVEAGESLSDFNTRMRDKIAAMIGIDLRGKIMTAVPGEGTTTEDRLWDMLEKTTPFMTEYYSGAAGHRYFTKPGWAPVKYQHVTEPWGGNSIVQLIAHADDPKAAIMSAAVWK